MAEETNMTDEKSAEEQVAQPKKPTPLGIVGIALISIGCFVQAINHFCVGKFALTIVGGVLWVLGVICAFLGTPKHKRQAELRAQTKTSPKRLLVILLIMSPLIIAAITVIYLATK